MLEIVCGVKVGVVLEMVSGVKVGSVRDCL